MEDDDEDCTGKVEVKVDGLNRSGEVGVDVEGKGK